MTLLAVQPLPGRPVGLYIHVPFCDQVCPYCDFAVTATKRVPHQAYAVAVCRELWARRADLEGRLVRTLYVGGGTPSKWDPEAIQVVFEAVAEVVGPLEGLEEVTLEANPVDLTPQRLEQWRRCGVTRLSVGCQSFQDEVLRVLGRNHSGEQAYAGVWRCVEGGEFSVSLDLIYGVPGQTEAQWAGDLELWGRLCEAGLGHTSAYALTVEPRTPFARAAAKGELVPVSDDVSWERLQGLMRQAEAVGMERYEVSSWAKTQALRSRHNTLYWSGAEYVGLGVGAHSLSLDGRGVIRRANTRGLAAYLRGEWTDEVEVVAPLDHLFERVYVGLRHAAGVCWPQVAKQFGQAVPVGALGAMKKRLDELVERGAIGLRPQAQCYVPVARTFDVADGLAQALWA